MTEADRAAIDAALNDDSIQLNLELGFGGNEVVSDDDVLTFGDVEWDTPELMPVGGRQEVVVTFHLTIESNVEDEARREALVSDAFHFGVDEYETAEYA
jgi:hypothetical protein